MVLLNKSYKGYAAGSIAKFTTSEEAALVAQGIAQVSAGPVTPGAVTANAVQGQVGLTAATASVVVTNALVDASSVIYAVINQAAADATALYVARIVPAAGSFTIYTNAVAAVALPIDWTILNPTGLTPSAH